MHVYYYAQSSILNKKLLEVKSMNKNREFTVFENDMGWRKRKHLNLLEADDFRRATFTRTDG